MKHKHHKNLKLPRTAYKNLSAKDKRRARRNLQGFLKRCGEVWRDLARKGRNPWERDSKK